MSNDECQAASDEGTGRRALRARYVFPATSPPIPGGIVTTESGRIVAVGREAAGADIEDLGNVAILPGLINAHTHLEFSHLAAPIGPPGMGFVDWISRVIALRRQTTAAPAEAIALGLEESARHGTTTLAEIAQPGTWDELLADPANRRTDWQSVPRRGAGCPTCHESRRRRGAGCPTCHESRQIGNLPHADAASLRVLVFLELIAPTVDRIAPALELARQFLHVGLACRAGPEPQPQFEPASRPAGGTYTGLSPHAPYSVHIELVRQLVALSAAEHVPLAMHLAESREEIQLLRTGSGPFQELLHRIDAWDPSAIPTGIRPLDYLRLLSQAPRALVIHGNYLDEEEIAFLAGHADRMAVVYCPRTHAWFGHRPYPLERLLACGATVALGTDSRATAPDLDVLAEARAAAAAHPAVPRSVILEMATIRAARALGVDRQTGSIEPGKAADLAIVPLPAHDADDPHDLLFPCIA